MKTTVVVSWVETAQHEVTLEVELPASAVTQHAVEDAFNVALSRGQIPASPTLTRMLNRASFAWGVKKKERLPKAPRHEPEW